MRGVTRILSIELAVSSAHGAPVATPGRRSHGPDVQSEIGPGRVGPKEHLRRRPWSGTHRVKAVFQVTRRLGDSHPISVTQRERTHEPFFHLFRMESNDHCKWADLSCVTDSQGRSIYFLQMADAIVSTDADLDTVINLHEEVWNWKRQPLGVFGPFRSVEEAEEWMGQKGVFEQVE